MISRYTKCINSSQPNRTADITSGTALAGTQLDATASVQGSFTYSPQAGAVLNAGDRQALGVHFIPSDSTSYNIADPTVYINVLKADQTITFGPLSGKTYGDPDFTVGATGGGSGNPVTLTASGTCTMPDATTVHITGVCSCTVTAHQDGDAKYDAAPDVVQTFTIDKAALSITAIDATKILNAPIPTFAVSYYGFVLKEDSSALGGTPTFSTSADPTSPVRSYAVTPGGLTSSNYDITFVPGILKIVYASDRTCLGDAGHAILQPINADGTSIFKQGSTVPAKFRVCDANGNSIGTAGVVAKFWLVKTVAFAGAVDETVYSTTPDTAFRWDATAQQWIFNMSTKTLKSGTEYFYEIDLNDSTSILFQFGLK